MTITLTEPQRDALLKITNQHLLSLYGRSLTVPLKDLDAAMSAAQAELDMATEINRIIREANGSFCPHCRSTLTIHETCPVCDNDE